MNTWQAHEHLILASTVTHINDRDLFITGGNDGCISIWDVSNCCDRPKKVGITDNGTCSADSDPACTNAIEQKKWYWTLQNSSPFRLYLPDPSMCATVTGAHRSSEASLSGMALKRN